MSSKVWKKQKNFKINRKGGRFSHKNSLKAEDLLLYRKTWNACVGSVSGMANNLVEVEWLK